MVLAVASANRNAAVAIAVVMKVSLGRCPIIRRSKIMLEMSVCQQVTWC